MKRFLAALSSCSLACAMALTPAIAETGTSTTTSTKPSPADCLVLLFTNPKLHAQECGTSNATPAAPPVSGGDGNFCYSGEIAPIVLPGIVVKSDAEVLVAGNPYPCCSELTMPPVQQLTPLFDSVWGTESKSWLVTATAC